MKWITKPLKRILQTRWKTIGLMTITSLIGYCISLEIGIPAFENQDKVAMGISDLLSLASVLLIIVAMIIAVLKLLFNNLQN